MYTMTSVQTWCWACPGVGTPGLVGWAVPVSREQGRNAYEAFFFVIVYFLLGLGLRSISVYQEGNFHFLITE
jgi:hypothetical protein